MKIIFMGTPDFAVTSLDALYRAGHEILLAVTQPDKPRGRKGEPRFSEVKTWALSHKIPVFQPDRIRKPENIEVLRKYPADIMVVAAYGQILPKEILDMPPFGCVNVHASLLPKYRGAAPIQWSILNGDKETGVTTMQMGVGLDDGDILEQEAVSIDPEETGGSLFEKLALVGGDLIVKTLQDLSDGKVKPIPQNEAEASHVGMLKKSMGNLIWSRPAEELDHYVRGLNPWPSAYSFLNGKLVKIWKCKVLHSKQDTKQDQKLSQDQGNEAAVCPGTILALSDQGIEVACGRGSLLLEEIQMEGKKRMDAKTFLLGHSLKIGDAFSMER